MHASNHARRSAFTLLELLIVVAVIALLIAILLPGLDAARRHSKRSVCATNLHQIAVGWEMYLQDYDGDFLQDGNMERNFGGRQGNGDLIGPDGGFSAFGPNINKPLNPYLKLPEILNQGGEVFFCPADTGSEGAPNTDFEFYGSSYVTNTFLVGRDQYNVQPSDPCGLTVLTPINQRYLRKLNRSRIFNPSKLVFFGDAGWASDCDGLYYFPVPSWHKRFWQHNVAFMDGHVEFLRFRKGLWIAPNYNVLPFEKFVAPAMACQVEILPPHP